jgi:CheY-like chemotaxis protein
MTKGESIDVLVVEDNQGDRESIVEALEQGIKNVRVVAVLDGTEALNFLYARGDWTDRVGEEPPRLILLDLELLGSEGGLSILGQIRSMGPLDALTVAPVVIFTDSHDGADIKESYRCGANSYIIKPLSFPDFKAVVETVGQYWMTHNQRAN